VVVCESTYRRYFSTHIKTKDNFAQEFETIRSRYLAVFNTCELLWESRPSIDMGAFTNPGLRLYRLPQGAADADAGVPDLDGSEESTS
jgi:hypothetical protein